MTPNDQIVLIDGYGQIYRAFHGMPVLTNPRGEPINALYGLARFLLNLDTAYPHEFGAVVFDKGPPRKRLELLPEYKAQRPPMPDELRSQLPPIREWVEAAGWPIVEEDGREADDLIAALVELREERQVYIVSHDKDLGQLVGDAVIQLIPDKLSGKSRLREVNGAAIELKLGVAPPAVADYLALIGDSSDNIPGVAGVGPKTAAALLQQFGDLETMLNHPERIGKAALRDKIEKSRELLQKNRELIWLDRTPPEGWNGLAGLRRRPPDWPRLREFALRNQFKSLLPVIEQGLRDSRNPMLPL